MHLVLKLAQCIVSLYFSQFKGRVLLNELINEHLSTVAQMDGELRSINIVPDFDFHALLSECVDTFVDSNKLNFRFLFRLINVIRKRHVHFIHLVTDINRNVFSELSYVLNEAAFYSLCLLYRVLGFYLRSL